MTTKSKKVAKVATKAVVKPVAKVATKAVAVRGIAPEAKIVVAAKAENPCREGSVHFKGFEAMRKARTYADFVAAYKTTDSEPHSKIVRNAEAKGFAKLA